MSGSEDENKDVHDTLLTAADVGVSDSSLECAFG